MPAKRRKREIGFQCIGCEQHISGQPHVPRAERAAALRELGDQSAAQKVRFCAECFAKQRNWRRHSQRGLKAHGVPRRQNQTLQEMLHPDFWKSPLEGHEHAMTILLRDYVPSPPPSSPGSDSGPPCPPDWPTLVAVARAAATSAQKAADAAASAAAKAADSATAINDLLRALLAQAQCQ